jgi:hypothetical protein
MPAPGRGARDEKLLTALMLEVMQARVDVRQGRNVQGGPLAREDHKRRCEQLAGALEAYADAAAAAGVPLPYRYRDEMRLYRTIYPGPRRLQRNHGDDHA